MGANTLGIDASESNIAIASVHSSADPKLSSESTLSSGSLSYLHSSAETLLTLPKRYDIVCSMEVLEHVDNPAAFLSTCAELLKVLKTIPFLAEIRLKSLLENTAWRSFIFINNLTNAISVRTHHFLSRRHSA